MIADLRLSVTKIESARLMASEDPALAWFDWRRYVDDLTKVDDERSEAMQAGTMIHSYAESLSGNRSAGEFTPDTYRCFESGMVLDTSRSVTFDAEGVHEIPVSRLVETDVGLVRVTGRVDYQNGLSIGDYKARIGKSPNHAARGDSLQWRLYSWMLDATDFTYKEITLHRSRGKGANSDFKIARYAENVLYPYDGMPGDCRRAVASTARLIVKAGLQGYCEDAGPRPLEAA